MCPTGAYILLQQSFEKQAMGLYLVALFKFRRRKSEYIAILKPARGILDKFDNTGLLVLFRNYTIFP